MKRSCISSARGKSGEGASRRDKVRLRANVQDRLASAGVELEPHAFESFLDALNESIRKRRAVSRLRSKDWKDKSDIIYYIQKARDDGDLNEACWRAFLAAHFGRSSTDQASRQSDSAGRLLCAFGSKPLWTWDKVHQNPKVFRDWLTQNPTDLATLAFGNHRKYESNKSTALWEVIESFLDKVAKCGGSPKNLFTVAASDAGDARERFSVLFSRLRGIERFGRTGRYDLLTLMADLKLIDATPDSCHLRGSTGPLSGARKLWGRRSTDDLETLADELATRIGASPQVVEDALCMWQKPPGDDQLHPFVLDSTCL